MPKKDTKKVVKKKNPILEVEEEETEEVETEETSEEETDVEAEAEEEAEKPAPKKKEAKAPVDVARQMKFDVQNVKAVLDAQPKVHFMVPLAEGEKEGAVHDVFINGYKYPVKKGVMVLIPQGIFELLAQHYKITSEAGRSFRIDGDDKKEDALS